MTTLSAIEASLVDMRNVGTHKSLRLTLHVPEEYALKAIEAFGWPTGANPVPVALARLDLTKIKSGNQLPDREAEPVQRDGQSASRIHKPVARDKRLAQRAGILCSEPLFRKWLGEISDMPEVSEDEAATYVRTKCGVTSRSEIVPGTEAAIKFDELYGAFVCWRDADQYIEAVA